MQTHVNNSDLCRVAQVSGAEHPMPSCVVPVGSKWLVETET